MLYLHIYTNALNPPPPLLTCPGSQLVTSRGQSLACPVSPAVLAPLHLNQTWPSTGISHTCQCSKVALQHPWQLGSVLVWSLLSFLQCPHYTGATFSFFSVLSCRLQLVLYWPIFSSPFSLGSAIFQGSANLFFL